MGQSLQYNQCCPVCRILQEEQHQGHACEQSLKCRYMKRAHFPGWARPFEFNAQLYSKLGREEEARDSARVALYTPWWTLKNGFRASTELARFPATADAVKDILSEVMKNNEGGPLPPGIAIATKTDEQVGPCVALVLIDKGLCTASFPLPAVVCRPTCSMLHKSTTYVAFSSSRGMMM